jgi:hypothetical protein
MMHREMHRDRHLLRSSQLPCFRVDPCLRLRINANALELLVDFDSICMTATGVVQMNFTTGHAT